MSEATDTNKIIQKELSPIELSAFCNQLAMILKSGISLSEGVFILSEETTVHADKALIKSISDSLELGDTLYIALKKTECFPKYMLNMVNIGEQSGRLEEVMNSLCDYYEREESIAKSIKSAITYPSAMIFMMIVVIGVLVIKVLPVFNKVFIQLGGEMSAFSTGLMNIGGLLAKYSTVILTIVGVLIVAVFLARTTAKGKEKLKSFGQSFFVTKKLYSKIAAGRFASAMSLMMSSGLDIDSSLKMSAQLVDNKIISQRIAKCQSMMMNGTSFSDAVTSTELFSPMEAKMISVGFKTGSAEDVMGKIASKYEDDIDQRLAHLISIIEPTLVAVLSVIVGLILLSVMLPILGVISSMG